MKNRLGAVLFSVLLLSFSPVPGFAQTALVPTISDNELTARIEFPGGVAADLSVTFEKVVGLNSSALALTATLVNPSDLTLLSRLPSSVSVPAGFPVVVRIEPSAASALAFEGVYNLSLHTHNLTLGANSPLRLYRAPAGGSFQDMTGYLQAGSVRAGGSGPGFSEFLIAADTRPVDSVIAGRFDALQKELAVNSSAITPAAAADLQQRLNQARAAYDAGSLGPAIDGVNGFADEVKKQSGAAIPNVWRANGGPANVAGVLRSAADNLKFGLVFKSNLTPLP
jgi:uncharacterized protein DUF6689